MIKVNKGEECTFVREKYYLRKISNDGNAYKTTEQHKGNSLLEHSAMNINSDRKHAEGVTIRYH